MFLLRVLIILAVGLMVQSAPIKRNKENLEEDKLIQLHLYCTADALHNNVLHLNDFGIHLPHNDINPITQILMSTVFNQFSNECKNFTIIMTLKHQLQDYLFNNENIPESVVETDNINKLSLILAYLQTMANTLDDIQLNNHDKRCLRLTSAQYKMMYYVQFTSTNLLDVLKNVTPKQIATNYYGGSAPNTGYCTKYYSNLYQ